MYNISRIDLTRAWCVVHHLEAINDSSATQQISEKHTDAMLRPLLARDLCASASSAPV